MVWKTVCGVLIVAVAMMLIENQTKALVCACIVSFLWNTRDVN